MGAAAREEWGAGIQRTGAAGHHFDRGFAFEGIMVQDKVKVASFRVCLDAEPVASNRLSWKTRWSGFDYGGFTERNATGFRY